MKKTALIFTLLVLSMWSVYGGNITILDDWEVESRIQSIQWEIPAWTPDAPGSYDQKGSVWSMLADMFTRADQKIKSQFILAFRDIFWATSNNNVPKWNGQIFQQGSIWDKNNNIGIGTTLPDSILHLRGSDPEITFTNTMGDASAWPNATIGMFDDGLALSSMDPLEANVDMYIDQSWKVGIGTTTPTTKLDVAGHIRTTNQVRANNYCDVDGNNCFQAGNLGTGTDNCYICWDNGATVQCKKFWNGWINSSSRVQISCTVGGTYTKTSYCKNGNSQGGLFAPSSASCSATATCNAWDIALRGKWWHKGAGSNYATALDYNDTTAWHTRVDNGLSAKSWGNPSTGTSFTYAASYSNGWWDKHEYIIVWSEVECLDF